MTAAPLKPGQERMMDAKEWQEMQDARQREQQRRMAEKAKERAEKEARWQKHLMERADGLERALWVTWNEI